MFKIGEEDFSFGDDEDFWCEALEVEASATAANATKPVHAAETTGTLSAQSHVQQNPMGSLASKNAPQPRSTCPSMRMLGKPKRDVGSARDISREAQTLQDANSELPKTPGNQAKRKFSFKQKSPRGGSGLTSVTAEADHCANKRPKQNDQTLTSFSNPNLQAVSRKLEPLKDQRENLQTSVSVSTRNLRTPTNQTSGSVRLRQPSIKSGSEMQGQGQWENSNGKGSQIPQQKTNGNLLNKTGQSQLRNSLGIEREKTAVIPNPHSRVPEQQFNRTTSKTTEGLPFQVGDGFEEEMNLLEDDLDWDLVPSSANAPQSLSTVKLNGQVNQGVQDQRASNSLRNNCNASKPHTLPASPAAASELGYSTPKPIVQTCAPNAQASLNQQKPNAVLGGASKPMGLQNNSALRSSSVISPSGQMCNLGKSTPRLSAPHSGPNPLPNFAQRHSQQYQGNSSRMNFQPCGPSPCNPTYRPGTQYPPSTNTPIRASTPGYTSPSPNFQGRGVSQVPFPTPKTPNIRTQNPNNSTPRQFSTPVQRFTNSTSQHRNGTHQGDRPFTTHGAKPQNRGTTTPQTPLLTSRVAQLFQTPTAGSAGPSRTRVRKFPGPAGVLPKLAQGQKLSDIKLPSPESDPDTPGKSSSKPEAFDGSEDVGDVDFSQGAWQTMKTDLGLEEDNPNSILAKNNIALVLRKASLKQLSKNKVPHLCVLIKAITFNHADASLVLRDPTGEMQGTMHRRLVEEHQAELKPGSVLVLRQVGVLSPSLRNHYLNITPSNLIQVYPSESSTLSQSSQRTPRSRTPRPSQRPSKEVVSPQADRSTPKRPGRSEVKQRHSRDNTERDDTRKDATSSKGVVRPQGGSRISEADSDAKTVDPTLNDQGGYSTVNHRVLNKSATVLEEKTTTIRAHHRVSHQFDELDGEATSAGVSLCVPEIPCHRKDVKETNNNSGCITGSDQKTTCTTINSRQSSSSREANQKGDDFTELLADIGDNFFDDF